jgi:iron complex outermembrane receptor protein
MSTFESRPVRHGVGLTSRLSDASPIFLIAVFGIMAASPALAQDAGGTGSADAASKSGELQEVVVTAQFRAQDIQQTPIAITAVNAATMEARGQENIADVAIRAPSVTFAPSGGGFGGTDVVAVSIRGVGQADFNLALEPGVGIYIDDVYYGTAFGGIFALMDPERVEILRGPQGTLSGKNSLGGAIKLYSQVPDGNGGGYVAATYGSYDRRKVKAAGDFTIVPDRLFMRVSGLGEWQDGYVKRYDYQCFTGNPPATFVAPPNPPDRFVPASTQIAGCELGADGSKNTVALRAALRYVISDGVEDTLSYDSMTQHPSGAPFVLRQQGASIPWFGAGGSVAANFVPPAGSYYNFSTYRGLGGTPYQYQLPVTQTIDHWGVANTLDLKLLDNLSLKSITAYQDLNFLSATDGDASPLTITNNAWGVTMRQFSQEVRLSGRFGKRLDWTVGGFYYKSDAVQRARVVLDGFTHGGIAIPGADTFDFLSAEPVDVESKSAFAHLEYSFTDELTLTGGIRYTEDFKGFSYGRSRAYPGSFLDASVLTTDGLHSTFSGNRVDYRATAAYEFTPQVNGYVQFATGFKGGGVNPRPYDAAQAINGSFKPETVNSYEVGVKSEWFDRHVRLNLAAYRENHKDIIESLFSCPGIDPAAPTPCAAPANVGEATIQGVEAEAELHLIEHLLIDLTGSYIDFQFDKLDPNAGLNLSYKPPNVPKFKVAAGVQYEYRLGSLGSLTPRFDFQYTASQYSNTVNASSSRIPGYGLLQLRLTYRDPADTWEGAFEVTNLTDRYYPLIIQDNTLTGQGQLPDYISWIVAPPREYAFTIKRRF